MYIRKINTELSAFDMFYAFKGDSHSFILDSSLQNERLGGFTFLGSDPFLVFKSKASGIEIIEQGNHKHLNGNPFEILKELLYRYKLDYKADIPFLGGAVGFMGYDLCHYIEKLPRTAVDDMEIPDCWFGLYDGIIAVDHKNNDTYLIALGLTEQPEAVVDRLLQKISNLDKTNTKIKQGIACTEIKSNFTKEDYIKSVQSIKDYISAGDIYQVNLTQRFMCDTKEEPFNIYGRLRELNPAPFSCYIDFGEGYILSSSPERFIKIQDREMETRPIKGTRPRGVTPEEDKINREELLASEKDRAELLMIVDLERNDLGKVSKTGTVKVPELFNLEQYATVHHLVSTVVGEMNENIDAIDVIQATFPGGSITGAPKIRAMEIIDELEPTQRNVYTGSIGYLGFNGDMDLNIAIRTIVMKDGTAYFQAGGAIVWDSDPELEYQESLHKARALIQTLKNEK
ncbi:MAG: aminodeoxychorismate synthase component I [Lutisporaceae bacterium]